MKLKTSIVIIWLTIIFIGIAYLFCHNEFVYSLLTTVPKNYKTVNCGEKIIIPQIVPKPVKLEEVTAKLEKWSHVKMENLNYK
jgi:hypothetical protein